MNPETLAERTLMVERPDVFLVGRFLGKVLLFKWRSRLRLLAVVASELSLDLCVWKLLESVKELPWYSCDNFYREFS